MLGLPLAFATPAVLGALLLLPALYYLLRVTPPRPRSVPFPPLRLLLGERPREETPARTPLWLLILRLAIAAAIIFAMAGPVWNPPPRLLAGRGPLLVVLDDGVAAAPDWAARVAAAGDRMTEAEREGRPVALLRLSEGPRAIDSVSASTALEHLRAARPVSFVPDREAARPALEGYAAAHADADVTWIADGLENGAARSFAEHLARAGFARPPVVVTGATTALALAGADNAPEGLKATVLRADGRAPARGLLRATDMKGLALGDAPFDFGGAIRTQATFTLPVEIRNDIARIEVVGEGSAGAVTLLDGRWKRRRVEIVTGASAETEQPLLSPAYFVSKALAPYAEVREIPANAEEPIQAALDDHPSVLVLADIGQVTGPDHDAIEHFVEEGGLLLRFAGSRLAGAPADDLEPVGLRRGGRTFGGALSWDKPKRLAPFEPTSPFAGLVEARDIAITRQVLAEPSAALPARTWAELDDGTPIVTADRRGKGRIVLFHVTADTTWSNLPLSGLFVDMLRRIVALAGDTAAASEGPAAGGAPADAGAPLAPSRILDGFGTLGSPPATAKPVPARFAGPSSADHPAGFYGPSGGLLAVNAFAPGAALAPADLTGLGLGAAPLVASAPVDLRPALLVLSLVGFLIDAAATALAGGAAQLLRRRGRGAVVAMLAATLLFAPHMGGLGPARAADVSSAALARAGVPKRDMEAALKTRLAFVATGRPEIDTLTREGLGGLSRALANRTALDPGDPVAVDPAHDDLAFYPLIYWPVDADAPMPSPEVAARVSAYMKTGGTVLFDTRDALTARPGGPQTPEGQWLARFLAGVDVPELEPVPRDHVITKTFYLLDGFVGRYASAQTWVEALPPAPPDAVNRPARSGDSVSPIIITGNDLAAAWASDDAGEPMVPLVPGGQRQRELAIRGGINLVMYTLTGNYKADQVHVRDLLDRLGH